jgi:hypothetical protein
LKLESPVDFALEIKPACVPVEGESFTTEDNCWISGWGDTKGVLVYRKLRIQIKCTNFQILLNNSNGKYLYTILN